MWALITAWWKSYFFRLSRLCCISVCVPDFPSFTGFHWDELYSIFFSPPVRHFHTLIRSPCAFFPPDQTTPGLHIMSMSCTGPRSPAMLHQCCAERKDHVDWPPSNTSPNAARISTREHCLLIVSFMATTPGLSSAKILLRQLAPSLYQCFGLFQGPHLAFPFAELSEVPAIPFFQPFEVPLTGSTSIWSINTTCFCIICKCYKGPLCLIIHITIIESLGLG